MADAGGARFIKEEKSSFLPTTRKLKDSEVSTIAIVAILAAAFLGFYFVLFPMFTKMNSLEDEIVGLRAQQSEFKNQIAQTEIYKNQYREAQANYYRYFTYFHSAMDPEIIDERVTSMLIAHGMTPASLSMTTLESFAVFPYVAQELRANPLPDTEGAAEGQAEAPAAGTNAGDGIADAEDIYNQLQDAAAAAGDASYSFVYTINVSAYGERANLYTFLAQVATMTAMYVTSFDFTDPMEDTPGQINMQIKMYVLIDGVPARDFGGG